MAMIEIIFFTLPIILLFVWSTHRRRATSITTNWPLVGMLPGILANRYRVHDYITDILAQSGGTFEWKGPLLCNMNMLFTSDPANIHHIFSKNFSNYPKGPEYNKIFEILGDGIFNADFDKWELHRRTTLSFFTHPDFYTMLQKTTWEKVENSLLPVLDHFCKAGMDVDLQDIFQRLTFDSICMLVLEHDPGTLRVEMPHVPYEKAFSDLVDALLYRHLVPEGVWRLQKWLRIGTEKKLQEASRAFDDFIYPYVDRGQEEKDDHFSLLATFRKEFQLKNNDHSRKFLRDTLLSLIFAGRDTTSTTLTWLFWLIARHPSSETKIRREIEGGDFGLRRFDIQESRKLVYLQAALCETLRLFPPVPLEYKASVRPDYLPSGTHLQENEKVTISFYSVGRMESVWGEDCLEFKPERWIMPSGKIKHEPSYKFPAFNVGPRTCLGKEMAFVQMKMLAAPIIHNYKFKLVEGHAVSPRDSIVLETKHGVKVSLSKIRNAANGIDDSM